jgi:Uma2 family endonuclease
MQQTKRVVMTIPVRLPLEQTDPPRSPQETLPTMYDLPSEDLEEPGLPDEFHLWQAELLSQTFRPPTYPPEQVFVASDLNLYYDPRNTGWYKRPDWFGVVGVPRLYQGQELRLSYVTWQEGVRPIVVIELLSPGTQDEDLGRRESQGKQPGKWQVYEQILGVPYYITFNRYSDEWQAFQLAGNRYQAMELLSGQIWIPDLELSLALWQGEYRGALRRWLRWYDAQGNWIPTEAEMVLQAEQRAGHERQQREQAEQRAEQAEQRAEQAEQRAQELAQRLRELGLEP